MAGEIVKWKPRELSPEVTKALEIVRGRRAERASNSNVPAAWMSSQPEAFHENLVEIARVCAVKDKPYLVRYSRKNRWSKWAYVTSIRLTPDLFQRNYMKIQKSLVLKDGEIEDIEECAWCAVRGHIVHCSGCGQLICPGNVTNDQYFTCRPSCTGKGRLGWTTLDQTGINPGR